MAKRHVIAGVIATVVVIGLVNSCDDPDAPRPEPTHTVAPTPIEEQSR